MSLVCVPLASQLDLSNNSIGGRHDEEDYDYNVDNFVAISEGVFVAISQGVQAIAGALRVNGAMTEVR